MQGRGRLGGPPRREGRRAGGVGSRSPQHPPAALPFTGRVPAAAPPEPAAPPQAAEANLGLRRTSGTPKKPQPPGGVFGETRRGRRTARASR